MKPQEPQPHVSSNTKPHYPLLDGLRGMAALMVITYHVFEGFATTPIDQQFNHGHLAVDFFFILSGFVIGYAYDDRWHNGTMNNMRFFRRRLIRLHPMVVLGAILGAATFCLQGRVMWDGTQVAWTQIALALLLSALLLPTWPGAKTDVRGNGELFPLNGPTWSLFFEYIGNIMYALLLHKLSNRALRLTTILTGAGLMAFALFNGSGYGHLGVGWTFADWNFIGGMLRMTFSYSMGLLLSRNFKPLHVPGAFWICSAALLILLGMPHLGDSKTLWINGLYEALSVIFIFPIIVVLGASGAEETPRGKHICKFLGDISYPLYIVHYPLMYLMYAWVWNNKLTFSQAWPAAVAVVTTSILLAYAALKLYDEPVRKWLSKKKA